MNVEKVSSEDRLLPTTTLFWKAGAKVKMDYELVDDAFNFERVTKEDKRVVFRHCPVGNDNVLRRFDQPYNQNNKIVMDNHPLMIMAEQKRKVSSFLCIEQVSI